MNIKFWGVRGSMACGSAATVRYGGNTACIALALDDGHTVIFDAGSGIRELGAALAARQEHKSCTIALSHGHWDHVMGLPLFAPFYDAQWDITICAPARIGGIGIEAFMRRLFDATFFPVPWDALPRQPRLQSLEPGQSFEALDMRLHACAANHGPGAAAYRLEAQGRSFFYSGDHELGEDSPDFGAPFFQAMRGVDVAVVDSQYTAADYAQKKGWGHSAMLQWPPLADALEVGRLVLSHFDPAYTDIMLDEAAERLRAAFPRTAGSMILAHEGLELDLPHADDAATVGTPQLVLCPYCSASDELAQMTDISHTFDSLLTKARAMTQADAGTLYLLEDGYLVFSYSQNETLFTASQWARQQYLNARLPVDASSIAGFTAVTGLTLNIPDVRRLPPDVPYSFNESFDKATGYRTVSMCVMPLRSLDGRMVGVMQLINSKDATGVRPFSVRRQRMAEQLCLVGARAIERGLQVRDMILRMLQTAALRDPTETAGHVMRVGAMTAELYHRWAEKRGMDAGHISSHKAQLRLASMLHDVGKVGISDLILKKPGRLTPEEREEMEKHCGMGARLFDDARFDMDALAREIALNHHQKWDGTGYTGDPAAPLLAGEAIPLGARLTAIADVFDALVSPRSYKEPWTVERAVGVLQADAGTHFDPEAVQAFVEIQDTMAAIRDKYKE